jgi:hypothetical protein
LKNFFQFFFLVSRLRDPGKLGHPAYLAKRQAPVRKQASTLLFMCVMKKCHWIFMLIVLCASALPARAADFAPQPAGETPRAGQQQSPDPVLLPAIIYPGEARVGRNSIRCRGKEGRCLEIVGGGNGVVYIIVYLKEGEQRVEACEHTVTETGGEVEVTYEPCED